MRRILSIVVVSFLLTLPGLAHAEWFIDPYLGASYPSDSPLNLLITAPSVVVTATSITDVKFEDSLLLGVRTGYWFPSMPNIGIALDLFHFSPDFKTQSVTGTGTATIPGVVLVGAGTITLLKEDISVIGLTPEVLLRLKLMESSDFPDGQFQPYASVGPAIFFIDAEDYDNQTEIGIQVGAGAKWMFTKSFGLFAEYRYMNASDVELKTSLGATTVKFEADFESHSILGGLSFQF